MANERELYPPAWLAHLDEDLKLKLPPGFELELGTAPKATASDRVRELVDSVAIAARGKRLGILGPRNAGKTTLHTYLRDGELTTVYRPTLGSAPAPKARRTAGDKRSPNGYVRLLLKRGRDVGGDRLSNYHHWESVVRDSQFLAYLFDTDRLLAGDDDHRREVVGDCTIVGQLIRTHHGDTHNPKLLVVGTHCDRCHGWVPPGDPVGYMNFEQRVAALQAVKDVLHYLRAARSKALRPPLILGALDSVPNAEDLTVRMFNAFRA